MRNDMQDVLKELTGFGIVPVVVIKKEEDAKPLANALVRGGLPCAEVTFRTDAAPSAIKIMTQAFPEMLVGAGTVISVAQVDEAVKAGAKFIVSPGFDPEVVDHCIDKGIPVVPGVSSPTEVIMGIKRGLNLLKFFPAVAAGGPEMIKAMSAPFPDVAFMPTGGINTRNLSSFLALKCVAACGGSWMVKSDLIENGDLARIEELTREAVQLVKASRCTS